METERKLSHYNAKGCLMGFQHVKNFSINKLGSKKDIYDYNTKRLGRVKTVKEEFIYSKSNTTEYIKFLQQ